MTDRIRWAAALVCAVLAAGPACAEDGPVKVGVLSDFSGPVSDLAGKGSLVAAQMAVEDFGATLFGKPIVIVTGDHQNKPDIGSAIVRKWFDEDGVDTVVDVPTSSVGIAVLEVTKAKNRVFLNTGGTSSDFTGKLCSPLTQQWSTDSYIVANGITRRLVAQGLDSWFLLVTDYTFGTALEADATKSIVSAGGRVVGSVRHPINSQDFSSYLLRAQASGAKVLGLANVSGDTIRSVQQAREFGLTAGGQTIVPFILHLTDVHALGLQAGQGVLFMDGFYWDRDEGTKAWTRRFMSRNDGRAPTSIQASAYSAVLHYLKSVQAVGGKDAPAVAERMRAMPIEDALIKRGTIRQDGKVLKDYYLLEVKKPAEQHYAWDYLKIVETIPGADVARPLSEGGCPLVH